MKAGALAMCACAGVGFALGAGCHSSGVSEPQCRRSVVPGPLILPARVAIDPEEKRVRGTVRFVGPRSVKIEDDQLRWYELELTGDTRVTWRGRNASALTFVYGTLLDATYRVANGELLAMRVEVVTGPE